MKVQSTEVDLTRRFLIAASAGLFVPRWTWAEGHEAPILYWKLEESGDTVLESVSGSTDAISSRTGHAAWAGSGRNRALRLDGYSVWIDHTTQPIHLSGSALTIAAWVALEAYPVNDAAIVQLGKQLNGMCSFSIDKWGYLNFTIHKGGVSTNLKSEHPVARGRWMHLAVVFGDSDTTLYIDGVAGGHGAWSGSRTSLAGDVPATSGRSVDCPVIANVFPTGVLNGLLREVRVFDAALSANTLKELIEESKPDTPADLQINGQWCTDDPQRPIYHAIPPRAWTNEPHGLIHWGGQYHLFYQKNANGPYWSHINWGHMTSPDLYRWMEMPVALSPEPGPDAEGCWSGSVIDHDGKLAILYTAGSGAKASICLAQSEDGIHFTKHHGNPIIPEPPQGFGYPEFRDPFVWREGDTYYLIIGSAIKDVGGTALLYKSKDLINWEYKKPLLLGDRESSGVFWEMPIFVKLGDQHALIVCEVPGRASYWVGTWKDETFVPHTSTPQRLELFNHLLSPTPHRTEDGRIITMGIIPDERNAKECWRAGWAHHYSLPRIMTADSRGRIHQTPLETISKWNEPLVEQSDLVLKADSMTPIDQASGDCLNIRVVFRRGKSHSVTLRLRCSLDGQEETDMHYEWETGRMALDRGRSSLDPNVRKDIQEATYFPDAKDKLELSVFLDRSVLEVFVDDRASFSARIYPTLKTSNNIAAGCAGGGAILEALAIHRMKSTT